MTRPVCRRTGTATGPPLSPQDYCLHAVTKPLTATRTGESCCAGSAGIELLSATTVNITGNLRLGLPGNQTSDAGNSSITQFYSSVL